jgi:hypothetical protein
MERKLQFVKSNKKSLMLFRHHKTFLIQILKKKSPIETGLEVLKIEIVANEPSQRTLGTALINLIHLRDQIKQDDWFRLYDDQGGSTDAIVHLQIQWIHSKVSISLLF